jgi:NADPH2:quinone reductase
MEGAGTVAKLGPGVSEFEVGDTVAYCLSLGSYAEYACVPAWKLVPVPDGVALPVATALMLQGSTAHYLSHSAFALRTGHTCLVHAGAGGVGQLLIQLAKRAGASVIATVGSEEKAEIAPQRGADHTILYRAVDFRGEVMRITGNKGVDVAYDSVGRDTLMRSIRSLKRRGVCISFGASSGQPEPVALLDLAEAGSVFLTRPHLADYMASAEEIRDRAADLFAAYRSGALAVAVDAENPLAEAAAAHAALEGRRSRGKLVLRVS